MSAQGESQLPQELRFIVGHAVSILGDVIRQELGQKKFTRIEILRAEMASLRDVDPTQTEKILKQNLQKLKNLNRQDQLEIALSFTLMLEVINSCENAYRSHRLSKKSQQKVKTDLSPEMIIYVVTAHPTEARSPKNIAVFHALECQLIKILHHLRDQKALTVEKQDQLALRHQLEIAWRAPLIRSRKPSVRDEAEHLYSLLFRDEVLLRMIETANTPFYIRSWVGGDKDGHPGVNERTLHESLTLSRHQLLRLATSELSHIAQTLQLISNDNLSKQLSQLKASLGRLKQLRTSDGKALVSFKNKIFEFDHIYKKQIGVRHPSLHTLMRILHMFPALVVPLELREDSTMVMSPEADQPRLAIFKMLQMLEKISRGGDPKWYARGFIISMTQKAEHLIKAARMQQKVFGQVRLPVIPLFEELTSLQGSTKIMSEVLQSKLFLSSAKQNWSSRVEVMVGYSDSAKEAGVLPSRVAISEALPQLEKTIMAAGFEPIFFHGSGGSIDRGGGSIQDQTAWWPQSALLRYKVTLQGEMVERSLATPAIAERQLENIVESVQRSLFSKRNAEVSLAVKDFAQQVSIHYQKQIHDESFLRVVEAATPYSYLRVLKMGSRPSKRAAQLSVKSLRAIPWVLCWTQTRVLFPTWWGVGTAWNGFTEKQKSELKKSFQSDPVFTSYVKALGFTLEKVELGIWNLCIENSDITNKQEIQKIFQLELLATTQFYQDICGHNDFLWFRPWLGESISLRSPMIHPLNLLQIHAKKNHDLELLRVTVTGISSGMLTTG